MSIDLAHYRASLERLTTGHPPLFSLVDALCDRHAASKPEAPAIIHEHEDGKETIYSFARLKDLSIRFANVMVAQGVKRGDRVALLLGHAPEMPIALIAGWRLGAIMIPISTVFSGEGLAHRLNHSGATALVTNTDCFPNVQALSAKTEMKMTVWVTDGDPAGTRSFWKDIAQAASNNSLKTYGGDEPAFMIYTSGTTGKAKGVLHSHHSWLTGASCLAMIHGDLGVAGDIAWCPAEWTWIAGFSGILVAFLYAGSPIVAWKSPHPFDPERVFDFMSRRQIRNTLLTPTMMRMMRAVPSPPPLQLRSLFCTGEPLTPDMLDYLERAFSLIPGEAYGQTECAPITVHNAALMPVRFGSLGLPTPGAQMKVVDAEGREVPRGEVGEIVVHRSHPNTFLRYWRDEATTATKLRGEWLFTGDEAHQDEEGYFWFVGRNDDIIKSSGYRIGPTEIEACIAAHPAVEMVAVVGLPDPVRGELVTAAVKVRDGFSADSKLAGDLVAFGRARLERHEYPRRVEFVREMPLTVTGKVMRKVLKQGLVEGREPSRAADHA
jgi:acetyl-CoA synthetase